MTAEIDSCEECVGNRAIAPIWANEVLNTPQLLGILPTVKFWFGRKRLDVSIPTTLKLILVMFLQGIPFLVVAASFASFFPSLGDAIVVVAILLYYGTVEKVARARLKAIYRPAASLPERVSEVR